MAKFKVKFEIQALELEIKGERDAVPEIANVSSSNSALFSVPSRPGCRPPCALTQIHRS